MKRVLLLVLCAVTALIPLVSCEPAEEEGLDVSLDLDMDYYTKLKDTGAELIVFNWGEYIATGSADYIDVLAQFEEITGIKVYYSTYPTNEDMYSKLKSGGAEYDIIIPSDYMISLMIKEDMLEKINLANIPNYQYIGDAYKNNEYDPTGEYSVAYTWGTVVLIYNSEFITETIDSWDALWDDKYSGKIIMFANSRDAFGLTLSRLGYSVNTTDENELREAADAMIEQKPLVQGYFMDEIFNKMGNGEAWIAPYYAGDSLTMMDDNPNLRAVYPKEGTNLFVDAMCIPKGAKNIEAAEMFINFMCEPVIAAANSEYIGYSTPNDAAYELLPAELKNNLIVYPSDEVLANTEVFRSLPTETNEYISELWREILGSSDTNRLLFPIIAGVLVVVCIGFIAVKNSRKKKAREMNK